MTVGVFRTPHGLVGRASRVDEGRINRLRTALRRRHSGTDAAPGLADRERLFEVVDVPRMEAHASPAAFRPVLQAWHALATPECWDASLLAHVRHVLIETLPEPGMAPRPRPPLLAAASREALTPRPTAAHPRAFRGTLQQLPKARVEKPPDLRAHLCASVHQATLLRRLQDQFPEAIARLVGFGYDRPRLASFDLAGPDPYLQMHHGPDLPADATIGSLPEAFVRCLLPVLRGVSWRSLGAFVGAFHDLDLGGEPPLLHAVAASSPCNTIPTCGCTGCSCWNSGLTTCAPPSWRWCC